MCKKNIFFPVLFLALAFFGAGCGNDQPSGNEAVLPHNLEKSGNLTDNDQGRLAAAHGQQAQPISPDAFLEKVKADTAALVVVQFWKLDCGDCKTSQAALFQLQQKSAEKSLRFYTANLDLPAELEAVNVAIRSSGLRASAYQLQTDDDGWFDLYDDDWSGSLPALYIRSNDGYEQFFSKVVSENELNAILQPFLL